MTDTPETDAQLTTFTSISKLKKPFVNRRGTVSAAFARGLERERNMHRLEAAAERIEHRMTKTSRKYLAQERNQLRTALAKIAEDCRSWLSGGIPGASAEFISAIELAARHESQAPLKTESLNTEN